MKEEYIKALEYIRINDKLEEADISGKFGVVGLWTLSLFRGYRSNVRQKEGLTAMRNKKDEIIDTIENDIISGKIKTREEIQLEFIKEEEKQKKQLFIWKIIFGIVFFCIGCCNDTHWRDASFDNPSYLDNYHSINLYC